MAATKTLRRGAAARAGLALAAAALLGGCGLFGGGKDDAAGTPVLGKRVPILAAEAGIETDPALTDAAVVLPPSYQNDSWTQPGGNAAKSMGHLSLGTALGQAWSVSIGQGSSNRARLAAAPVAANNRVFTIDTQATIRAFDLSTGRQVWETSFPSELPGSDQSLFGGGVSVEGDRIYAVNGVGDVGAFEAATGKPVWRVRPGGPMRGAPTIGGGNLYVVSQDNQIFALAMADGATQWTQAATLETAGVFGAAAPAIGQGTVVAGFSSGELNAYRYENGRPVWQDALSRTSISTAVAALSDIDADPVIAAGTVYAVGQGGRMVAMDIVSGQRAWEINLAGTATPWVAGDWLFVVTDDAKLVCLSRATGKARWITSLQRWRNAKKRKGLTTWVGPVLAGNRLILANNEGQLVNVDPLTGTVQTSTETKTAIDLPPIVVNGTLLVLDHDGRLTAWR